MCEKYERAPLQIREFHLYNIFEIQFNTIVHTYKTPIKDTNSNNTTIRLNWTAIHPHLKRIHVSITRKTFHIIAPQPQQGAPGAAPQSGHVLSKWRPPRYSRHDLSLSMLFYFTYYTLVVVVKYSVVGGLKIPSFAGLGFVMRVYNGHVLFVGWCSIFFVLVSLKGLVFF